MHNWFECKVLLRENAGKWHAEKSNRALLGRRPAFTEAEARIIEEIRPFITGEFTVTDIKRARLSELFFNENGDRFYKIKVILSRWTRRAERKEKPPHKCLPKPLR